jgi:hypothetical protein
MQKTRELFVDTGQFDRNSIPYSTYTFPNRQDRMLAHVVASGFTSDTFDDFLVWKWTNGDSYYGFNKTGVVAPRTTGQQDFYSSERKKPLFNNCTNAKSRGVCYTYTLAGLQSTGSVPKYNQYWTPNRYITVGDTGSSLTLLKKHTAYDWSNAQRTAWWTMQPEFEGNISLFNFIVELKDFRELAHLLRSHPIKRLRNFFRRQRWKKGFDPTRPVAEAHLFNEFALKPLVSDILTITAQIEEIVRDAQSDFAEAGLGRNSRHWSDTVIIDDGNLTYGTGYYQYGATGQAETQTFTATMEYNYNYSCRDSIDAIMRYWGLTPTWEALWNALPFSFLVDYVIKVGDSIAAMETDPNVELLLNQYCESLLTRRSSGSHFVTDNCYGGTVVIDGRKRTDPIPLYNGYESSLYTRRVAAPNRGAALPRPAVLTSGHAVNFAALLRCFF